MTILKKEGSAMDRKKIAGHIVNQSYADKLLLWLLSATAAILLSFQTMTYTADDSAGSGQQEKSLVVTNWKGQYIGTSHRVVMDPAAGVVAFVIVSVETGQNKGTKEIAVPWVLFSVDKEKGVLVLKISKKQLESAPEYRASELGDPEFIARIYRFFALTPPWTEETPQGKPMRL
jgi:sporulation protein YlmC with PRC-barrel domain